MLESAIKQPVLRTLLDHWVRLRGARQMPTRDQIDPTLMAACLPYIWICRRGDDGEFVCVLAGEEVQQAWGHSIMSRPLAEVFGDEYWSDVRGRLLKVLETPAIQHAVFQIEHRFKSVERLSLPVADGSGRPVQILGGSVYQFDRLARPDPGLSHATRSPVYYDTRSLMPIPETPGSGGS